MALYGAFSNSMLGMMSQARSLQNIGSNIANVNTGGYKGTDTGFSTVLSQTIGSNKYISDIGGVRPKDIATIDKQGFIVSSELSTDVAISGKGFFIMNTAQDGSGDTLYGRDGSFEVKTVNDISVTGNNNQTITVKDGYLADKNGYFIQGWAYQNGTVTTTGATSSLRVDQFAFINQFEATTQGTLTLNLPAGDDLNHANPYDISVYDSAGSRQSVQLNFSKTGVNAWEVATTTSRTPVAQVDTVTLGGNVGDVGDVYTVNVNGTAVTYTTTGAEANMDAIRDSLIAAINGSTNINSAVTAAAGGTGVITITSDTAGTAFTTTASVADAGTANTAAVATTTANITNTVTSTATAITFNADGTLSTPTTYNMALTFAGGSTATVALDISNITQFEGPFLPNSYTKNGFASSNMRGISFDSTGDVYGQFEDNTHRKIYKLALGVFANANALEAVNGNVYKPTQDSGSATVTTAGATGYASLTPNARELSNVDMAEEFTKMMMTQTAYNASSTVFRTTDEMTTVARDLKR